MGRADWRIVIDGRAQLRMLSAAALAVVVTAFPVDAQSGVDPAPSGDQVETAPCAISETTDTRKHKLSLEASPQPERAAVDRDERGSTAVPAGNVAASGKDCIQTTAVLSGPRLAEGVQASEPTSSAAKPNGGAAGELAALAQDSAPQSSRRDDPAAPSARTLDNQSASGPVDSQLAGDSAIEPAGSIEGAKPATSPEAASNGVRKLTFKPGFREQARYAHDEQGNQRLFNRRLRLKGGGNIASLAKYYVEVKIDNLGQFENEPKALVENAWLEFPVLPHLNIRTGLYDVPFSRNALTSDSKLLLMDRSLIKNAITSLGMADNTVGVLGHGRPFGGRFEYSVGLFNNFKFKKLRNPADKKAGQFMPAGRVAFHLLDPATPGGYADYRSSYVGQGRRLTIGANTVRLGDASDGLNDFDLQAYGTDLFFNDRRFTFEAEYDRFIQSMKGGLPDVKGHGWYAQAGYMLTSKLEAAARHQQLDANLSITGNKLKWTSLGFNYYFREHHIKFQAEYTFRDEQTDRVQLQFQMDY